MRSLLFIAAVMATGPAVSPASVLEADVPGGFEFASDPPTELSFEEYAELAPDAVEHVAAGSPEATEMVAAVDVWTAGSNDILLREVTRWGDADAAEAFVEQAVVVGALQEFDVADPPVEGGVAFVAASRGLWTRTTTWRQGPFAVTIEHFSLTENDGRVLRSAAEALNREIEDSSGHAATDTDAARSLSPNDVDGGGFGTILLGLAGIALSVFLVLRFFRRRRAADERQRQGEQFDVDDIDDLVERTRARTRARRDVDEASHPFDDQD